MVTLGTDMQIKGILANFAHSVLPISKIKTTMATSRKTPLKDKKLRNYDYPILFELNNVPKCTYSWTSRSAF